MSAHVDSVTMAKRSGGNAVELQIFHVQVGYYFGGKGGEGGGDGRRVPCALRSVHAAGLHRDS